MTVTREIKAADLTRLVSQLCREANEVLPQDVVQSLQQARLAENDPAAVRILGELLDNAALARQTAVPICQDTGLVTVYLELGIECHFDQDPLAAIQAGVRQGYAEGFLRKSVVADPLHRTNTEDNTPAFVDVTLVPGDTVRVTVAPKGFGSENMSRLAMLKPAEGVDGVKDFVVETVRLAGANACPPVVVGVGIGGTFDQVARLAKRAGLRELGSRHPEPYYTELEQELLTEINRLGIGPQGFGGRTTALAVQIETLPTHIAGLPVAVSISCHVTRHQSGILPAQPAADRPARAQHEPCGDS